MSNEIKQTIRDCPVCVVGGAGFLGSHVVDHLINDRGCKVLVIDNLSVCGGKTRGFVHPHADFEYADITKSESHLCSLFKKFGVECVFNYAAYPYIPDSFARPLHVFETNAVGAMNVINAAQACHAWNFVPVLQISSAELYGGVVGSPGSPIDEPCPIDENDPVEPHSSYGVGKAAVDSYVQVRWREAKTPCIALRQFNCVGERETHPYVVPEIISQLSGWKGSLLYENLDKEHAADFVPTICLGNNSTRDFLYAGDQARIAVELLERGEYGEVYNLGSEEGIKIYDLAKMIGRVMGLSDVRVEQDESRIRPWEIWHLQSDNSKIRSALGRFGRTLLEDALRRTVAWYQGNGCKWPWE